MSISQGSAVVPLGGMDQSLYDHHSLGVLCFSGSLPQIYGGHLKSLSPCPLLKGDRLSPSGAALKEMLDFNGNLCRR